MEARTEDGARFARLQVELVVEVTDRESLVSAALDQVEGDPYMPDTERGHAIAAVTDDETEALAFLVDPYELVSGVPGIELAQASWRCGPTRYAPQAAPGVPGAAPGEAFPEEHPFEEELGEDFGEAWDAGDEGGESGGGR